MKTNVWEKKAEVHHGNKSAHMSAYSELPEKHFAVNLSLDGEPTDDSLHPHNAPNY